MIGALAARNNLRVKNARQQTFELIRQSSTQNKGKGQTKSISLQAKSIENPHAGQSQKCFFRNNFGHFPRGEVYVARRGTNVVANSGHEDTFQLVPIKQEPRSHCSG